MVMKWGVMPAGPGELSGAPHYITNNSARLTSALVLSPKWRKTMRNPLLRRHLCWPRGASRNQYPVLSAALNKFAKNPNPASATAQAPPHPHPRPPPCRPHSFTTEDQTKRLASRPASHCCTPPQGQDRKIPPTTETTSRTTAPTNRGPRRWGGHPATPPASPGHPPTRKTDFLLALTFSARHAALLVVLAVQLALVVVVGAARATAPVADPGWVPGLVSRLDGQHEVLGEAGLLCRRR